MEDINCHHNVTLRSEFGEYGESDWFRTEIEGNAVTVFELEELMQRFVESMGFSYVQVNLETKGERDE
jgi:hypothetical protein